MIPFKDAIKKWEEPFREIMIGYSALTRKARISPCNIFVIPYCRAGADFVEYRSFDVGLKKSRGRWVVDESMFDIAIAEKIKTMECSNMLGKTNICIDYPIIIAEVSQRSGGLSTTT
jgi:hypothetical protein